MPNAFQLAENNAIKQIYSKCQNELCILFFFLVEQFILNAFETVRTVRPTHAHNSIFEEICLSHKMQLFCMLLYRFIINSNIRTATKIAEWINEHHPMTNVQCFVAVAEMQVSGKFPWFRNAFQSKWFARDARATQMTLHLSHEHHLKPLEIQYERTFDHMEYFQRFIFTATAAAWYRQVNCTLGYHLALIYRLNFINLFTICKFSQTKQYTLLCSSKCICT